MSEPTNLGLLLKRYRMAAGLSQEALARRAELSARAISDLERGLHRTPHAATLDLLASALTLSGQQRALLLATARPELTAALQDTYPSRMPGATWSVMAAPGLPTPPTTLIGREDEYSQALRLLGRDSTRLVTFTGASGVGKTRLALQIAHSIADAFPDGAVFVDLAPIRDAALVPGALAQALHLREQGDAPVDQQVIAYLRDKQMLALLDNFEQVIAAAPFVAELLAWCARVSILVTSRTPLHLRAEQTLHVAPLALEDAIVLFRERANAIQPGGPYAVSDVAAVCERVDCLPLAIELIAGQTPLLSLPSMLEQLDRRAPLVMEGARDLPARQRTMEAAIGWSYDLLSAHQRRAFRALAVFVGGFTLAAARAILGEDEPAPESETLLTLAGLVDASLIQVEITPGGYARFHMLHLIREFALARLRAEGEEEGRRHQHAAFFAALADPLLTVGFGADASMNPLNLELPNARAALEWASERRDAPLGLQLTGFIRVWNMRGATGEAIHWLATMLALDAEARAAGEPAAPVRLRVERLYGASRALLNHGDLDGAEAFAREAVALAEQGESVDNADGLSSAWATVGMIAQARGDLDQASAAFTRSAAFAGPGVQSETRYRALYLLSEVARNQGDLERACILLEQALSGAEAAKNAWDMAVMTTLLAHLARQRHEITTARTRYLDGLARFYSFGSPTFFAWCLEGYCALLASEGAYEQATRFCATASTLRQRAHTPLPAAERAAFEEILAQAREALGAAAFDTEWGAGSRLTEAAVLAEAPARV